MRQQVTKPSGGSRADTPVPAHGRPSAARSASADPVLGHRYVQVAAVSGAPAVDRQAGPEEEEEMLLQAMAEGPSEEEEVQT